MIPSKVLRITRITLPVHDLQATTAFYTGALGFAAQSAGPGATMLKLGEDEIELLEAPRAAAYPWPRAANDPWFQHFAIAVSDMDAAYQRLSRFAFEPITWRGPQLLPPHTGSVTAYKFRDPDGHPIELSYAPGSHWSKSAGTASRAVHLGIDHTALAASDLEASLAFYTGLGFRIGERSLNQGPEQARLDGLADAMVEIVTLFARDPGPHIELLCYRAPAPAPLRTISAGDIAATLTTIETGGELSANVGRADPNGHLLRFTAGTTEKLV